MSSSVTGPTSREASQNARIVLREAVPAVLGYLAAVALSVWVAGLAPMAEFLLEATQFVADLATGLAPSLLVEPIGAGPVFYWLARLLPLACPVYGVYVLVRVAKVAHGQTRAATGDGARWDRHLALAEAVRIVACGVLALRVALAQHALLRPLASFAYADATLSLYVWVRATAATALFLLLGHRVRRRASSPGSTSRGFVGRCCTVLGLYLLVSVGSGLAATEDLLAPPDAWAYGTLVAVIGNFPSVVAHVVPLAFLAFGVYLLVAVVRAARAAEASRELMLSVVASGAAAVFGSLTQCALLWRLLLEPGAVVGTPLPAWVEAAIELALYVWLASRVHLVVEQGVETATKGFAVGCCALAAAHLVLAILLGLLGLGDLLAPVGWLLSPLAPAAGSSAPSDAPASDPAVSEAPLPAQTPGPGPLSRLLAWLSYQRLIF